MKTGMITAMNSPVKFTSANTKQGYWLAVYGSIIFALAK